MHREGFFSFFSFFSFFLFLFFCTQGKAQDCKAIPRRAVRRCITNNYSPPDRRDDTQNGEKTRRYRNLQSATTKRHFPHLECGRAKCLQIEFGGAKPRQPTRITLIFNERAFESIRDLLDRAVRKSKRGKLFAFSDTYRLQFNSTFPAGSQGFLLCSRTSPVCPPL